MGPSFRYPSREIQAWGALYIPPAALALRRDYSYLTVARLKPGVSVGAAAAHMATIAQALAREHPSTNRDVAVTVAPLQSVMTAAARRPLLVLLGAVGMLFAITVFSIVNLVLVQLAGRAPELALRATLGASRPRLAAQLLGELVPLAVTGALAGLAGAYALLRSIVATLPATLPRVEEIGLHLPVALFGIALTAAAMGIPAIVALWNARTSLRRGPASWVRLRDWLVTAQVAATVTLLVASALFATSLARLRAVDPGLDATRVLTLQLAVDRARHGDDEGVAAYLGQLADSVRAVPGVEAVGLINRLPLGGQVQFGDIRVEGQDAAIGTSWRSIDAGYTTALRVPLIAGRGFDARDTADAPRVGLVDERLAAMLGGPRAVLGKRFRIDVTGLRHVVGRDRRRSRTRPRRRARARGSPAGLLAAGAADTGPHGDGGPRRRRPGGAGRRRAPGDPQRRRRSVDRGSAPDDGGGRAQPRDVSRQRAVHGALRGPRARAGGDGPVRRDGIAQPAAAAGVRRPAGARRDSPRAGGHRPAAGAHAGRARRRLRPGRRRAAGRQPPRPALRRHARSTSWPTPPWPAVMLAVAAVAAVVPAWHAARTDPLTSLRAEP